MPVSGVPFSVWPSSGPDTSGQCSLQHGDIGNHRAFDRRRRFRRQERIRHARQINCSPGVAKSLHSNIRRRSAGHSSRFNVSRSGSAFGRGESPLKHSSDPHQVNKAPNRRLRTNGLAISAGRPAARSTDMAYVLRKRATSVGGCAARRFQVSDVSPNSRVRTDTAIAPDPCCPCTGGCRSPC